MRQHGFKIILDEAGNPDEDIVVLCNGQRYRWIEWLGLTTKAVSRVRAALDTQTRSWEADWGHDWLVLCGIKTKEDFETFEKQLPLLQSDSSARAVRICTHCGSKIWGREALVTGLGSKCRKEKRK